MVATSEILVFVVDNLSRIPQHILQTSPVIAAVAIGTSILLSVVLVQTLAAVLAGTVTLASEWMLRSFWWGGGRRRDSGEGQFGAIMMVVALLLAVLAPLAAMLIQMAISRKREYLADASAAMLTRYPPGLAGALRKISADPNRLRVANKATESLFIANPLKDYGGGMNALFNTHPPIEERIRRLEAM